MRNKVVCESRDAMATLRKQSQYEANPLGYHLDNYSKSFSQAAAKALEQNREITRSDQEPIHFSIPFEWQDISEIRHAHYDFWMYKNRIYREEFEQSYTDDEKKLLVMEEFDKERKQFERLHDKFNRIPNAEQKRQKIPSDVRIFVWQRDSGRCVECGSNENLEYDHIIPFAKGGSNTERNLQLLCGNCNRLKSDNIQ